MFQSHYRVTAVWPKSFKVDSLKNTNKAVFFHHYSVPSIISPKNSVTALEHGLRCTVTLTSSLKMHERKTALYYVLGFILIH